LDVARFGNIFEDISRRAVLAMNQAAAAGSQG
jgi:hypothetical protein